MGQKKLKRFSEIRTFPNFLEYPSDMQGKWCDFFNNQHPIVLELACGKGEYAVGMGTLFPEKNFIGIDLKSNRMWVGARKALNHPLPNVAFLRSQIDKLPNYFAAGEVAEIWITFPDPQLRFSKAKKRLTHPRFLRLYQQVMASNGTIHLKTDSPDLYFFTKKVIDLYGLTLNEDIGDLYAAPPIDAVLNIKTHYESLDIAGKARVHYLRFQLDQHLPDEKDLELKELIREEQTD
jgi:tRNA (guanine-N7-)-methyltransferase